MAHGWIITKDYTEVDARDIKVFGPADVHGDIVDRLSAGEGEPFRMLDDDNIVYFTGRLLVDESMDDNDEFCECYEFSPLDDFGGPGAGCVDIQYKENGKWMSI